MKTTDNIINMSPNHHYEHYSGNSDGASQTEKKTHSSRYSNNIFRSEIISFPKRKVKRKTIDERKKKSKIESEETVITINNS